MIFGSRFATLRSSGSKLFCAVAKSFCAVPQSGGESKRLRVLVDMDGVLADFEGGFLQKYKDTYPDEPFVELADRRGFWVSAQYGQLQPELCGMSRAVERMVEGMFRLQDADIQKESTSEEDGDWEVNHEMPLRKQ